MKIYLSKYTIYSIFLQVLTSIWLPLIYPIPRHSHTLAAIPAKVAISAPVNVQFIFVTGECFLSPVAIKYTEIV